MIVNNTNYITSINHKTGVIKVKELPLRLIFPFSWIVIKLLVFL